jgi:hypothetical protein
MSETILILKVDSHFHGNDKSAGINKAGAACPIKQTQSVIAAKAGSKFVKKFFIHRVFKKNNVRNYINIKNGFPFSWE